MTELKALQEKAAQLYVQGRTKSAAYREAGYSVDNMAAKTINEAASRLFADSKVSARVKELQAESKQIHQFTIDDAVREYDEARLLASQEKQAAPMISATKAKCDLFGLDAPKKIAHGTFAEWMSERWGDKS